LHEVALIRGNALAASKKIEEGVAVLGEYRANFFGCLADREWASMCGIGAARAMTKQNSGKGA